MLIFFDLAHLISAICLAGAGTGCVYLLIAAIAVLRFPRQRGSLASTSEPVTILKPLQGSEPGLLPRLTSFCNQTYSAPVQVICGVQDRSDPAVREVEQIVASGPTATVGLVVEERAHGCNRKVSNLTNMLDAARHDVLVIADSDIEVGPDYLASVVAPLQEPGVGAVTCLFHGIPAGGTWSRQAALAINAHFLPSVVVALSFGLAQPCFGSTIALRRGMLCRIGGFKPFADCLADDYAIGMAVRSAGYTVSVPSFSIGHLCFEDSLHAVLARELRAVRTIKSIDPVGCCGAIITHPFPLALIGALLGGANAILFAIVALACRMLVCRCVERAFQVPQQDYWLIPICDLLAFSTLVTSFFSNRVAWRGFTYRVSTDGKLISDWNDAPAPSAASDLTPSGGSEVGLLEGRRPWPAQSYTSIARPENCFGHFGPDREPDSMLEGFEFSDSILSSEIEP
jgi:ceramide glucosyltransferase